MYEASAIIDIGNKSIRFGARTFDFNFEQFEEEEEFKEVNQCSIAELEDEVEEDLDWIDHVYEKEEKSDKELLELTESQLNHLEENEKQELLDLIGQYRCVFADKLSDLKEPAKIAKFKILTTDEMPVHKPVYRTDKKTRELIEKEIHKFLDAGLIRYSTSPYSAPVVPVKKKNDPEPRSCIDFRGLNFKTIKNGGPIIKPDDIFDELSEAEIFTEWDLKAAFHQQEMDVESIEKTAFSTWSGIIKDSKTDGCS